MDFGTIGPWGGRLESEIPGLVYDPDAVNLLKKISIKDAFVDDSEIPTYRHTTLKQYEYHCD